MLELFFIFFLLMIGIIYGISILIPIIVRLLLYVGPLFVAAHYYHIDNLWLTTFWLVLQLGIWIYFFEHANRPPLA